MTKRPAFVGLLVFYGLLVMLANQRHLWHDELYTLYIANSPTLGRFWEDLRLDLNPPLSYLLARVSIGLFGATSFAVRLPSMIAFLCGSLCLHAVVARRYRSSYGLLAVLIFWTTPAFYFATEARPYALILGFFGLAMLAWQRAVESGIRVWPVLVLCVAVEGMMLSHFFAILFLTPFLLAELVRAIGERKPDWRISCALLLPCVTPFFFLRAQAAASFPPAFQAGVRKMLSYYYWTLHPEGWVLLLALCIALAAHRPKLAEQARPRLFEIAFIAGLLALPVVVNASLMTSHGAFFTRYAAPQLFAYPLILAYFASANRLSAIIMSAVVALYLPTQELAKPPHRHLEIAQVHPDLPLVAASGLTFLEMDHDEPEATVKRLYYLTDREYAMQYAHATLFEGLPTIKQRFPIRGRVEPLRAFVRNHREFLVLGTPEYAEDWLLRYLRSIHARLELVGEYPSQYKDSQLFLVEVP